MIACVDVGYNGTSARAACVTFERWEVTCASAGYVMDTSDVQPYVPGQFDQRELPCALAVLEQLPTQPDIVVVDGYVWRVVESANAAVPKAEAATHTRTKPGRTRTTKPFMGSFLADAGQTTTPEPGREASWQENHVECVRHYRVVVDWARLNRLR